MNHDAVMSKEGEPLKSLKSRKKCCIRFLNFTRKSVDVIWVNYEGTEQHFAMLESKQAFDVDTYETHPWIFRDHFTRQHLYVDRSPVYYPKERNIPVDPPVLERGQLVTSRPVRVWAIIKLAVYPLTALCLISVRRQLRSQDDVSELEIPHTLRKYLTTKWHILN